jgi:hypothetical protein
MSDVVETQHRPLRGYDEELGKAGLNAEAQGYI